MAQQAWCIGTGSPSFGESKMRWTTLYDLIASLGETMDVEQEHLLTPLVLHFLQEHHVTWWDRQRGYRLVWDTQRECSMTCE